jgi:hypothetical protein
MAGAADAQEEASAIYFEQCAKNAGDPMTGIRIHVNVEVRSANKVARAHAESGWSEGDAAKAEDAISLAPGPCAAHHRRF